MMLAGAVSVFAADIPAKLGLADAVALALGTNANLKSAEESKRTALSKVRIAGYKTSFDIGSSAEVDKTSGNSNLTSLISGKMSYENLSGTVASLNLSPLGSGSESGAIGLSIRHPLRQGSGFLSSKGDAFREANIAADIENKQLFISHQAIIQNVIEAYYSAVQARELVKVSESAVDNAEKAADGWRKREEAGMAAGIDVSNSEILVAQTKNTLNTRQRGERDALDKLMVAIGGGVGQTPELTDSVPDEDPPVVSLQETIKTALENRAELDVYDKRITDYERQYAVSKDKLRPSLNLVAAFSSESNHNSLLTNSIFDAGLLTAGFEYNAPMDKRISQENMDTAKRQIDIVKTLREYQIEQIIEAVRSAYRSVESGRAQLVILAQNVKVAEDSVRFAQLLMDEGQGTSRDLLNAQQDLTEAKSNLLSARTDLYLAGIDLKYAMGQDLAATGMKRE